MIRRGLTPTQWRRLPREDKLEILAHEQVITRRRDKLLADAQKKIPGAISMLAQVMLLMDE